MLEEEEEEEGWRERLSYVLYVLYSHLHSTVTFIIYWYNEGDGWRRRYDRSW